MIPAGSLVEKSEAPRWFGFAAVLWEGKRVAVSANYVAAHTEPLSARTTADAVRVEATLLGKA